MKNRFLVVATAALIGIACPAFTQQRAPGPRIGYVFPAGGQAGTSFDVIVGGQNLRAVSGARITGEGVQAAFAAFDRPMTQREALLLRDRLDEARKKLGGETGTTPRAGLRNRQNLLALAAEAGITADELRRLAEFQRLRSDPKRQPNPQIEEKVTLHFQIEPSAGPGVRELRLLTPFGATNPLRFEIGALPEATEFEPNDRSPDRIAPGSSGCVVNGQILPGDVDRFTFPAKKGEQFGVAVHARDLMPYLADTVPGWFEPIATVMDSKGKEIACADHDRFRIDPVLRFAIPADGDYVLEIRDTLYRGREDFVYRTIVEKGLIAAARFPDRDSAGAEERSPTLPERAEAEPNNDRAHAQSVPIPCVIAGRIGRPGDLDVYRIDGRAGQEVAVEVVARRLGSPLDSVLQVLDARGKQLAANDDFEDRACGLLTHQADSRLMVKLPVSGPAFVVIRDAQRQGGGDFGYRLRISGPIPDFALLVSPSTLSVRAGGSVTFTATAVRRDGFAGPIALSLNGAAPGFSLKDTVIPSGKDEATITLRAPMRGSSAPTPLRLAGTAVIGSGTVAHAATPADDMMQAFAYHHLVPAQEWLVTVFGRPLPNARPRP